jgi:hypothetical protein
MLNYVLRTKHVLTMKYDETIWIGNEIWNKLRTITLKGNRYTVLITL